MEVRVVAFVVLIGCAVALSPEDGYVFPDRYQALVTGVVADFYSLHQPIQSTGWMFTDYTEGTKQRIDEIWNITTILHTPLYTISGITADTHLFFDDVAYFYYNTVNGSVCSASISGKIGQYDYDSPDCFRGEQVLDGQNVYVYQSLNNQTLISQLYVSQITGAPVLLSVFAPTEYNTPTSLFDYSNVYFLTFDSTTKSFPKDLFAIPSYCPAS
ncbi:hypothetical protein Pelo_7962 [Pelomyxa schiedti]|nr:hypothetical protein Pelo_7962 [Pelomyxa schiedti]